MASMIEITCKCGCKRKRMVRTADVKRGWGKYFNKSCKAIHQTKTKGRHDSKRQYYEKEFGGVAQFNHNGKYEGFTLSMEDMREDNGQL